MGWGALQMILGVLGTELFTSRTAFVITLIGAVWTLGGKPFLKKLAFPLFLLFLMVPIPAVIYNQITFPLQIVASKFAEWALDVMNIPVLREGNILDVAGHRLSVMEACSGIRSLLTLTFLALVYGYFFEKRLWVRVALFLSVIPVAILANGSRVTITGAADGDKTGTCRRLLPRSHRTVPVFRGFRDFDPGAPDVCAGR